MNRELFADLAFPLRGIDLSQPFGDQLPMTTALALNVRANEAMSLRQRGGQRAGLEKYIADQLPTGAGLVQLVDVIVDPQGGAMADLDDGDFLDPSDAGPSRLWGHHFKTRSPRRRIRRGGTGRVRFKNRKVTLHVIPFDQNKGRGATFTFAGTEFDTGPLELDVLDELDTVTLTSAGSAASALPGTYPIIAKKPVTGRGLENYRIVFQTGTMTVLPMAFVQAAGAVRGSFASPQSLAFTQQVTQGNLLLFVVAQDRNATVSVNDTLGNTWVSAGTGTSGNLRLRLFFAVARSNGPCTVNYVNNSGGSYGLGVLEYSGLSAVPLDSAVPGNSSYHTSLTALTTQAIPVSGPQRLAIAAFAQSSDNLTFVQDSPWKLRVNQPDGATGMGLYVMDQLGVNAPVTGTGALQAPGAGYVDFGVSFK